MKSYKIQTLTDILKAVNEKNIDGFLKDFEAWLRVSLEVKKFSSDFSEFLKLDEEGIGFTWNDDNENGVLKEIRITINDDSSDPSKGE